MTVKNAVFYQINQVNKKSMNLLSRVYKKMKGLCTGIGHFFSYDEIELRKIKIE